MATDKPKVGKNTGNAGKGRPKGARNKTTTLLKEAILMAAEKAHKEGSVGYLTWLAQTQPSAFAALLGRVLPMQVTGEDGGPVVTRIELVAGEFSGDSGD